jgi:hypothetical protein
MVVWTIPCVSVLASSAASDCAEATNNVNGRTNEISRFDTVIDPSVSYEASILLV